MTKRQTRTFRGGEIIDITEYHDGNYGAPGKKRIKRDKPTREAVQKVNRMNKTQRCRWKMLTYINPGDLFATLTYRVKDRPASTGSAPMSRSGRSNGERTSPRFSI